MKGPASSKGNVLLRSWRKFTSQTTAFSHVTVHLSLDFTDSSKLEAG